MLETGKGRMPSFPHLLRPTSMTWWRLLTAAAGRARFGGRWTWRARCRGGLGRAARTDRRLRLRVGASDAAAGCGRGAPPPYPEGARQWKHTRSTSTTRSGNRIAPPFTSIVKYDLNEPRIQWRIGFGDDPGAGRARHDRHRHARHCSTASSSPLRVCVFGAGRDNQIRAWDSDTGKQLWSSRFGGDFIGSPVMYQMDGRQYLLVPAAAAPPRAPALERRRRSAGSLTRCRVTEHASPTVRPRG